ncbi:calmodulin-regulated spectrin-associated protein 2-like, partial [Osmerus eperlanus]|uniref:calmodulin-regulated spectrin-associated protein 2-like n=1 Tax=Osmerus eperlanus TaxID=29151 RepID=UPI002E0FE591
SSHLALIDTLMMAYTVEMVSVERVVACVSRLGPAHSDLGPAHSDQHLDELPYDTEEAITTWINKVNGHLRDILVEEQKVRESSCPDATTAAHKSRYRREAGQRVAPLLPLVDSLLKDNTDGCALAALLHYYCPRTLPLEDVCLKETMSLADSLYNLQLVQDLCRDNLNHCCHFSLEDMLYAHASIKSNYLVFMAELFWWFEVVKPSFVQPRVFNPQACEPVGGVAPVCSPANHSKADTPGSPADHRQAVSPGLPDNASLTPNYTPSGIIRRSASMSYVDGSVGTWPKERRSSSRGISFEIPLDGDPSADPCVTPSPRGMRRSASSEGLGGFKVHHASRGAMRRHVSLPPVTVNGQAAGRHIPEEEEDSSSRDSNSQKPLGRQQTFTRRNQSRYSNGVVTDNHRDSDAGLRRNHGGGRASPTTPPSIEEALKIIHATERPHGTLGAGDHAFFLHRSPGPDPGPDPGPRPASVMGGADVDELTSASTEEVDTEEVDTEEVDTGIHVRTEDIQESQDEDSSSLRDYSDMDPDWEPPGGRTCPLPQTPDREGERGRPGGAGGREGGTASPASSSGGSGGVRMTSFAEQKFRKLEGRSSGGTTPESSELNVPYTHSSRAATPEARSPAHPAQTPTSATPSPRDPSHMLASEMVHLKMKLEEKRRAIEAQKKKVEEAFTRHRQRMGRTAFLNVVRRKGVIPSSPPAPLPPSPGPGDPGLGRAERCKPDGAAPKSPCEDGGGASPGEVDLVEYTHSIERLNTS